METIGARRGILRCWEEMEPEGDNVDEEPDGLHVHRNDLTRDARCSLSCRVDRRSLRELLSRRAPSSDTSRSGSGKSFVSICS